MDKMKFLAAIEERTQLESEELSALKKWVVQFPYFTSARLLYLKSIQFSQPLVFPLEVKKCAAHIGNRERMYALTHQALAQPIPDLARAKSELAKENSSQKPEPAKEKEVSVLESQKLSAKEKVKRILEENRKMRLAMENGTPPVSSSELDTSFESKEQSVNESVALTNKKSEIKEPLIAAPTIVESETAETEKEDGLEQILDLDLPKEEDSFSNETSIEIEEPAKAETIENSLIGSRVQSVESADSSIALEEAVPTEHRSDELLDTKKNFFHWLKELRAEERAQEKSTVEQQKEIIDKFLVKLPGIKPDKAALKKSDQRDLVQQSLREDQEMVTETLAKLYLEQGHLNKALDAFEILLLRFPQKSSFFAGQIREIRKSLKEKGKK